MHTLKKQLLHYWESENKVNFFVVTIFLSALIAVEYIWDAQYHYFRLSPRSFLQLLLIFAWYAIPLVLVLVLSVKIAKLRVRTGSLMIIIGLIVFIFSVKDWFYFYEYVIGQLPFETRSYARLVVFNLSSVLLYVLPICLFALYDKSKDFYGLINFRVNWLAYGKLLMPMLLLVFLVSFTQDFQAVYPVYKDYGAVEYLKISKLWTVLLFELSYGLDYVATEFFFRGFAFFLLVRVMGRHAVLPMAFFYTMIHFGRPLGETIGSFFGGIILGVFAYESRSIWGGVLLHLGIAYAMEFFAFLWK